VRHGVATDARAVPRYRFLRHVDLGRFDELLAASDLLLTLNVAATTIGTALAARVPVLALGSAGRHPDVHPFRVWPLGLAGFLAPVLAGNPYLDAIETAELLDGDATVAACRRLLHDPVARDAHLGRRDAYVATLSRLPSGADLFLSTL
jgi:hypothetical protein